LFRPVGADNRFIPLFYSGAAHSGSPDFLLADLFSPCSAAFQLNYRGVRSPGASVRSRSLAHYAVSTLAT
jgi:hypothetical protein